MATRAKTYLRTGQRRSMGTARYRAMNPAIAPRTAFEECLRAFLASCDAAHGVVARVERPGCEVWQASAGIADARSGAPVRPDSTFRTASNTKTFTAAA